MREILIKEFTASLKRFANDTCTMSYCGMYRTPLVTIQWYIHYIAAASRAIPLRNISRQIILKRLMTMLSSWKSSHVLGVCMLTSMER